MRRRYWAPTGPPFDTAAAPPAQDEVEVTHDLGLRRADDDARAERRLEVDAERRPRDRDIDQAGGEFASVGGLRIVYRSRGAMRSWRRSSGSPSDWRFASHVS